MNSQQTYQESQTSDTLEKRGDGWPFLKSWFAVAYMVTTLLDDSFMEILNSDMTLPGKVLLHHPALNSSREWVKSSLCRNPTSIWKLIKENVILLSQSQWSLRVRMIPLTISSEEKFSLIAWDLSISRSLHIIKDHGTQLLKYTHLRWRDTLRGHMNHFSKWYCSFKRCVLFLVMLGATGHLRSLKRKLI